MQSKFLFLVLTFLLIMTCSTLKTKDGKEVGAKKSDQQVTSASGPSMEAKQAATLAQTTHVVEIVFPKGQIQIPKPAMTKIKKIYEKAKQEGRVTTAKVITWSDQEYPSAKKKSLPSEQLKLVEDRNDNLENYIEALSSRIKVDKISMAERPGVLESILSEENIKIRKSLESSGIKTSSKNKSRVSKASKSIVMFVHKKLNI